MKKQSSHKNVNQNGLTMLLLAGLGLAGANQARAIGLLIPNQDAFSIGRGNAVAATANNPSAIYYNPAGISQLTGSEIEVGELDYIGLNVEYHSPTGQEANTKFEVVPVPQIYFTTTPTNLSLPLSFGLGVYAPFGLGVKWQQDSVLRSQALDSKLQYFTVNPVVSYQVLDNLSLAVGPTINYGKLDFNRGLVDNIDYFEFKGDDIEAGFNAGILWKPLPKWSLGLSYRYSPTMHFSGVSTYAPGNGAVLTAPTTTAAQFPMIASGGLSFCPTPKWNVEADVDYINWHNLDTLTLSGSGAIFHSADLALPLHFHDSWSYKIGVTRYFDNGWYASAGYYFTTDTTSDTFYQAGIPDADLHVGSLGIGHDGEHWHWAVAGELIASFARNVNETPQNTNPYTQVSTAGSYTLFIPTFSISVGYHF